MSRAEEHATRWQRARTAGRWMLARLDKARTLGIAAEMAFWLFLSFLPLAAVAGLVVAKVASNDVSFAGELFDSLPAATRELVTHELASMSAWNGGRFGVVAALMFFWLASSGIASLLEGIEVQTESKPRSWIRRRAIALGACVGLSLGIAALTFLGLGLGWLRDALDAPAAFTSFGWTTARAMLGAALALLLVSGLYYLAIPRPTRDAMPIFPGAAIAFLLQTVAGLGYGAYVRTLGDGGAYQAGLASIGVTMIALYILCVALLVGVEVNQVIGERQRRRRARPHARGGRGAEEALASAPG